MREKFKISNIQLKEAPNCIIEIAKNLDNIAFSITIGKKNSKQMDSNIDEKIIETIKNHYFANTSKKDLAVKADGSEIGTLDLIFSDTNKNTYYMEIEKTNKKTLWFDYIKLLTRVKSKSDHNGYGIIICPSNYAHSNGVWNLYQEAVIYKNHLKSVFGERALDRISIVGYTQYVLLNDEWLPFNSDVIKKIKTS